MTETTTSSSTIDRDSEERTRAALSAEDTVDMSERYGIGPIEYVRTKHGVNPGEYETYRSLQAALYPEREAELADGPASEAARGAAVLAKRAAGKPIGQATREVNGTTEETAALSASDEVNERARAALPLADSAALSIADHSPAKYVAEVYTEDPREYDEYELRAKLRSRQNERKVESRRERFHRDRDERAKAKLRERVARDVQDRHGDPDPDRLAIDALAGTARGHRLNESPRSPAQYVREEFGVDPQEYETRGGLREAIGVAVGEERE